MKNKVAYIWERGGWPGLQFQMAPLQQRLTEVREARTALLATVRVMEGAAHLQAAVETMTQEVVGSSAIEGVNLSLEAVRDSLMLRLGGSWGGFPIGASAEWTRLWASWSMPFRDGGSP